MSKICLHLSSAMPTVFCIDGQQVGCCDSPCNYIDIVVCQEQFVLYVYPVEQISKTHCSLSYSAKINCTSPKPTTNTDLITITDYGQSHYVLFANALLVPRITDNPPCFDTCDTYSLATINNNISVSNNQHNFHFLLKTPLKTAKMQKIGDFYAILGKNDQNLNYVMLLNQNLQLMFECWSDKIEVLENKIITLDLVHDIAQHGKVAEYSITNGNVHKEKSYFVYTQNTPSAPANQYAIPFAFLEAISLDDFSLARSYLHPTLGQTLQNNTIQHFFGDFVYATPSLAPDDLNSVALVYPGTPQFVKKYRFEISDNLIKNIDTIE